MREIEAVRGGASGCIRMLFYHKLLQSEEYRVENTSIVIIMAYEPSSASAQIRMPCGVADEKTRLPSKLTTRCCERTPAISAVSSKTCLKSSCCDQEC